MMSLEHRFIFYIFIFLGSGSSNKEDFWGEWKFLEKWSTVLVRGALHTGDGFYINYVHTTLIQASFVVYCNPIAQSPKADIILLDYAVIQRENFKDYIEPGSWAGWPDEFVKKSPKVYVVKSVFVKIVHNFFLLKKGAQNLGPLCNF
jgi:hypothetical protein